MRLRLLGLIIVVMLILITGCSSQENKNIVANEEVFKSIPISKSIPIYEEMIKQDHKGIKVLVLESKAGVLYGFVVSGFSDYDEDGKDIFNASVSVLAQNTIGSLENLLNEKVETQVKKGYVKCIVPGLQDGTSGNEAAILIKSAIIGFISIEQSYGKEFIQVEKAIK